MQFKEVAHPTNPRRLDLTGRLFGRLRVVAFAGDRKWHCVCECGQEKVAIGKLLTGGKTRSCGCLVADATIAANRTHGMAGTKIYRVWRGILTRCLNDRDRSYTEYGARGIGVCDRWRTFEHFYEDMGEPPTPEHSIERVDNDKGYEPSNCCWATRIEQARNRRSTVWVTANGKTLTAKEWDSLMGFSGGTVAKRVRSGWSHEDAVNRPVNKNLSRPQVHRKEVFDAIQRGEGEQ